MEPPSIYQTDYYVTTSIKAVQPYVKFYSAQFAENGFVVKADG